MKNSREILAAAPLFAGMPADELATIAAIVMPRRYGRGDGIFSEGDPCIGFYIVAAGQVKIYKSSREGKEQILHIFGPGEPIGEVPVFSGKPYPANAEALSATELLFVPRDAFVRLVTETPSIALNLLAILSLRLRQFTVKIENLSLKEVSGRLAAYLLHQADEQGGGVATLDITKAQLASLLGTIPETLSRVFARLAEQGTIEVAGRSIRILDAAALRELS